MSKKLLLADDSITIQKVIGITFAHEDYELIIADNGDAALEMARNTRPDLVLADVYMPGKNGYELCAAIKKDPTLKRAPVLLLSGTFESFDEKKAEASGADSWISKPFESQALIDRVEELLANVPVEIPEDVETAPEETIRLEPAAMEAPTEDTISPRMDLPDIEADMWDELDLSEELMEQGSDIERDSDFGNIEDIEEDWPEEESEEEGDTELWGAVSFSEEDLGEDIESEEDLFEEDDFWESDQDLTPEQKEELAFEEPEESFAGLGEDRSPRSAEDLTFQAPEPDEIPDEEILPLEDVDILEEESLGADDWEEEFEFQDEEDGFSEDISSSLREVEVDSAGGEVFSFEKLSDENSELEAPEEQKGGDFGISDPEEEFPELEEDFDALEVDEIASEGIPGTESVDFLPRTAGVFESANQSASVSEQVEKQVQSLDEEEITRIVEKIAGAVIEKMANSVLEKIAWEVVPDLAESMIRDEIRKIKEKAQ